MFFRRFSAGLHIINTASTAKKDSVVEIGGAAPLKKDMRSVVPVGYYTCRTGEIVAGLHATHREKGAGGGVIVAGKMAEKQPRMLLSPHFS